MTATFLLVRHAPHIHLDRLLSGRMPGVPLSEEGRDIAARLAQRLAGEAIDGVACSPLERTRETAEAVARACGVTVAVENGLIELDMGDWTGRGIADLHGDPAWGEWNTRRSTARIPGGETMAEAQGRIVEALDRLAGEWAERTLVVVSHADMIKAAVAHVLGLSLDRLGQFDVSPASTTRMVWGDWGARVMTLNETERE